MRTTQTISCNITSRTLGVLVVLIVIASWSGPV